jgi:hypothetical protein
LQDKCQRCHRDPPENGAPFALITYADTQVKHDTTPRYELMQAAVTSGFMPFVAAELDPPVASLTCEQKETLLAWLEADAPPAPSDDPDCEMVVPQQLSCP